MLTIWERIEDQAVEPQLIEVVRSAFHKTCDVLDINGGSNGAMSHLVAEKILELVKAGETNPDRLCGQALIALAEQMGSAEC